MSFDVSEPVDERVARVGECLFFMFTTQDTPPGAWRALSDNARESWMVAARRVLAQADK